MKRRNMIASLFAGVASVVAGLFGLGNGSARAARNRAVARVWPKYQSWENKKRQLEHVTNEATNNALEQMRRDGDLSPAEIQEHFGLNRNRPCFQSPTSVSHEYFQLGKHEEGVSMRATSMPGGRVLLIVSVDVMRLFDSQSKTKGVIKAAEAGEDIVQRFGHFECVFEAKGVLVDSNEKT